MNTKPKKSRTLLERCQAIFSALRTFGSPLYKSDFQKVGISPKDIDQWLELIQYIQRAPLIQVRRKGRTTLVEILENDFLLKYRHKSLDQTLPYHEREEAVLMYLHALINMEKVVGEPLELSVLLQQYLDPERPRIVHLDDV